MFWLAAVYSYVIFGDNYLFFACSLAKEIEMCTGDRNFLRLSSKILRHRTMSDVEKALLFFYVRRMTISTFFEFASFGITSIKSGGRSRGKQRALFTTSGFLPRKIFIFNMGHLNTGKNVSETNVAFMKAAGGMNPIQRSLAPCDKFFTIRVVLPVQGNKEPLIVTLILTSQAQSIRRN